MPDCCRNAVAVTAMLPFSYFTVSLHSLLSLSYKQYVALSALLLYKLRSATNNITIFLPAGVYFKIVLNVAAEILISLQ